MEDKDNEEISTKSTQPSDNQAEEVEDKIQKEKDSKTENLERESENQGRVEKVNQPETSETQTDQGKILDQKEDVEESDQKSDEKQSDVQSPTNLEEQNEESEDEGIDATEELDHHGRDAMYERGVQLEKKKKKNLALKCYLQCLKGLNSAEHFSFLPQCLRKIADIYFEKEELEKAIQFIQAEKMFYETALIDTSELEKKLEERKNEQSGEEKSEVDVKMATPEIVRADEYEKLAKMCLKQKQPQLALEYQGKATKLRQEVYGNDHAVTTKSLDFFTVIYGEVGKQQYSESMQKLANPPEESEKAPDSPQSILRRRKKAEKTEAEKEDENKEEKKKVRFADSRISREQEEWISHKLLLLLFFFSVLTCCILVFYIYCKTQTISPTCSYWKTEVFYYYMRIKYFYHYYFASGKNQVVG